MSKPYMPHCHIVSMNKFMNSYQKALEKPKELPKSGGRGIRDKDKPRDKNVRITSELYEEMMEYIRIKKGQYNSDFHDVCSEVWEFFKKEHKEQRHD
ncbi:MAG TPA: hypothetical protein VE544_13335 [Nitrososphaeraceae archaeon]|nr:hypothetical protein [Nitrososphaeraceae archaeon]